MIPEPTDVSGDRGRINGLYVTHRLYLVRMAAMLVDDLASAEDIVQDVFYACTAVRVLSAILTPYSAICGSVS